MDIITSRENPKIKETVRLFASKTGRRDNGLFAIEGARLCFDAASCGITVLEAFMTEKAAIKYVKECDVLKRHALQTYIISDGVAGKLSGTSTTQGIFAVCERPRLKKPDHHAENARYLLLDGIQDPGNLGSIIRTAEAFSLNGICVSGDCPGVFSPKVSRASMGGVFRLPIWEAGDMLGEIKSLISEGVRIYAAVICEDSEKLGEIRFEGPAAVLFGNEGAGLPKHLVEACDSVAAIPMRGGAESLGVAAAAGIFAWEMTKQ